MNKVSVNEEFTNYVLHILFDDLGVEPNDAEFREQIILRKAHQLGLINYNLKTECFERK